MLIYPMHETTLSRTAWQAGRTPAILFSLPGNDSRLLTVDTVEMTREVRPGSLHTRIVIRLHAPDNIQCSHAGSWGQTT